MDAPIKRIRPDAQYSYWLFAWSAAFLAGLFPVAPTVSVWLSTVFTAFQLAVSRPRDPLLAALVVWVHLAVALLLPPPRETGLELGVQLFAFLLYLLYLAALGTGLGRVLARNVAFQREAAAADVVRDVLALGRHEAPPPFRYGID